MDQINWVLVFLVGNFGLSLFNSFSSRHKVAQDELNAAKGKLDAENDKLWQEVSRQGRDLAEARAELRKQPNHDDLAKVYTEINNVSKAVSLLNSNISEITGKLSEVSKQLDRMDTFWRAHDRGN